MRIGASYAALFSAPGTRHPLECRSSRGRGLASLAASRRCRGRGSTGLAAPRCHPFPVRPPDPFEVGEAVCFLPLGVRSVRYWLDGVRYALSLVRYGRLVVRYSWYSGITRLPIVDPGPSWQAGFGANVPPLGFSADLAGWRLHLGFSRCPWRSRVFGLPSRTSRFARRRISSRQAPRSGPGPGSGPSGGRGTGGS